ncbi:S1C family serine protease [Ornithinicoccus hortensis]|uniref:Putative serine protease PepD n=1 Tax=Ornithinicoccus hortensis TaxID=82346 RepID=A0A542YP66_9MICO|nr:trypsin-like peptidase domain-containing protein [Ornithinicoccus hortensis]TQL49886.1 putative serine protease PepD [Ornithinicoccus hortensis]
MSTQTTPRQGGRASRWGGILAVGLLSAGLASGGTYAVVQAGADDQPVVVESSGRATTQASNASLGTQSDWGTIAEKVGPSVVSIGVSSQTSEGAGSGVVWDTEGHIVTNAHVVAGADRVRVTLADGRAYDAEVAGEDSSTDLAVITLTDPPDDLVPIALGDDQALTVGQPVMAIGNPLGLSGTVTTGIVSALDRPVTTQSTEQGMDPMSQAQAAPVVTNAIQTSAAINPGNSGGALVDASGALVGINSSIASLSSGAMGGQSGSIGIGFAIPVSEADSIAEQLIEEGTAEHAFLGVGLEDATATVDSGTSAAAGISQVEEDSPAASAGLKKGDVITDIDGERVDSALALVAQVRQRTTGDEVVLGYVRDGERHEVTVTLDARPDDQQQ